jgi:hypothetical protein
MGVALAVLLPGSVAVAQEASAWWATGGGVDDAVRCPAIEAWLRATDVEQRDEEQASTEELADVATGPELAREQERLSTEQQRVSTAAPQAARRWASYSGWTVTGGTSQEVVIYATNVVRSGPADETGKERSDAEQVETVQAAYRMVLENGAWRLADQHVFEQQRHALDSQLGDTVIQQYQRLFESLIEAYNARDADALQAALDGPALEQYRAELQQLADQQDDRSVDFKGQLGMLDADPSGALMAFQGTRSLTGTNVEATAQAPEPTTLVHRLELRDGQWKIVDEAEMTVRRDADGTEHVAGCG